MGIISKYFTVLCLMILSSEVLANTVPRASENVWKMFLSGHTQSIPSSHWVKDGRNHIEMVYDDSYFLQTAPDNFKDTFPIASRSMYSTQKGYPSFLETASFGHQCVAFAKAATGDFNLTKN